MKARIQLFTVLVCTALTLLTLLVPYIIERWTIAAAKSTYFHVPSDYAGFSGNDRLVVFADELRVAPHFSLSATDLSTLTRALGELENDTVSLSENYESDSDRAEVTENFYPFDFWYGLIETERSRRDFIGHPTQSSAHEYITNLNQAMDAYIAFIDHKIPFLDSMEKRKSGLVDGATDIDNINLWLEKLSQEAVETKQWLALKKLCLNYYQPECISDVPAPALVIGDLSPEAFQFDADAEEFLRHVALREHAGPASVQAVNLKIAPIIVHDGACSMNLEAEQALLWWNTDYDSDLTYARFSYFDELLFFDHRPADSPYTKLLLEHGVPFQLQLINHYLCWQYGHDFSELTTAYAVWDYLQSNEIFTATSDAPTAKYQQLSQLEDEIRNNVMWIETARVSLYVRLAYQQLLSDTTNLTDDQTRELRKLILAYRDKSSFFADEISNLSRVNEFTFTSYALTGGLPIKDLVYIHSALSLTLHAFNETVDPAITSPVVPYPYSHGYAKYLKEIKPQNNLVGDLTNYYEHAIAILKSLKRSNQ